MEYFFEESNMVRIFKLLRVKNYIKNLLVLLPIVFSKNLFNFSVLPSVIFGFVSFCALSSAVYIFNDLCDYKKDKLHPQKCKRPIASGEISKKTAVIVLIVQLAISFTLNFFACETNLLPWLLVLGYLFLNVLYSLKLKHIPLLDVVILVTGFIIRVFYGAKMIDVSVSNWLYLTVLAISFYMGLGKRRNEFKLSGDNGTRSVLCFYSYDFLDKNMYVCSALSIVFYSLWCVDSSTIASFGSNRLIYSIPLIILICITYSLSVEKSKSDDPVDVVFENKILILLVLIYGLFMVGLIYF